MTGAIFISDDLGFWGWGREREKLQGGAKKQATRKF